MVCCGEFLDCEVGEALPSECGVAHGGAGLDGEYCVEEEYALLCPVVEVCAAGCVLWAEFEVEFAEYVVEGAWDWLCLWYGECESDCVAGLWVWVLSEDYDSGLLGFEEVECVEEVFACRIDCLGGVDLVYVVVECWVCVFSEE